MRNVAWTQEWEDLEDYEPRAKYNSEPPEMVIHDQIDVASLSQGKLRFFILKNKYLVKNLWFCDPRSHLIQYGIRVDKPIHSTIPNNDGWIYPVKSILQLHKTYTCAHPTDHQAHFNPYLSKVICSIEDDTLEEGVLSQADFNSLANN